MKERINGGDLITVAASLGLTILPDASGYTVRKEMKQIFPEPNSTAGGESKRACAGFLLGVKWEREQA